MGPQLLHVLGHPLTHLLSQANLLRYWLGRRDGHACLPVRVDCCARYLALCASRDDHGLRDVAWLHLYQHLHSHASHARARPMHSYIRHLARNGFPWRLPCYFNRFRQSLVHCLNLHMLD